MAKLAGKWKLESTENFDEYMKAVGVGMALRKLASMAKPSQEITVDGDSWNIKTKSNVKNSEVTFTIGQEFDEKTADGRNMKTTCSVDGDTKMTMSQKGEPDSTLVRELTKEDAMTFTLTAKDATCVRVYKRES